MTALFRPVLIESAAQAEALAVGTVAVSHNPGGAAVQVCIRVRDGWLCTEEVGFDGVQDVIEHQYMVGDTALVPIEAEEERITYGPEPDTLQYEVAVNSRAVPGHRFVTPWEDA